MTPDLAISDLLAVLDTIEEAIVVYDKDGGLVYWNDRFKEIYAYRDEDLFPGQHFSELGRIDIATGNVAIGDDYGTGEDYLARKREYRTRLQGSFTVQLKDGRWIKTTDRRLTGGGFVSVQTDITALRSFQDQLEAQVRQETEKRMEIAGKLLAATQVIEFTQMSSGYAHDLNNMLLVLEANADQLMDRDDIPDDHRPFLMRIEKAVAQARTITQAMLGKSTEKRKLEKIDVVRCITETLELFRSTSRSEIRWAPEIPEGALIIYGSNLEFVQVVLNLLVNASDAVSPQGGRIDVSLDVLPAPQDHVPDIGRLDPNSDYVLISVADNGCGIPETIRKKIFDPYVSTKGNKGTGLGLAVVSSILAKNHGGLSLESEEGVGTLFQVYWPSNGFAPDPGA